ncbi:hypothetical protein M595_2534 [Lyngbya aestuarii BL J]|uniref:Uncharacterized protein n=1 Tax=Lyngbya aestuarii BL J TaxID=1348334 RepID=U7QK63_9CYAN|nr:hypothetical protein [Lyngbya aestuarii]ERT07465.1 hypothetical protein M595_2534 [Lyngbya aestuarii BL J]
MKTQNIFSQIADAVKTQSALSTTWTVLKKSEVNHASQLNWIEKDHTCQAAYTDELGTIELYIKKEIHHPIRGIHHYRVSYQYRSPDGSLIAQGIWEPKETIDQAKRLAEFQLRQFL